MLRRFKAAISCLRLRGGMGSHWKKASWKDVCAGAFFPGILLTAAFKLLIPILETPVLDGQWLPAFSV